MGEEPPSGGFSVAVFVADIEAQRRRLDSKGVPLAWPLTEEYYGLYCGVRDPNGVMIYFVERRGDAGERLLRLRQAGSRVVCRGFEGET